MNKQNGLIVIDFKQENFPDLTFENKQIKILIADCLYFSDEEIKALAKKIIHPNTSLITLRGKNSSHLEDIIDEEVESSTDLDLTHIVTMSFVDEPIEDVIYLSVSMNSLENNHLPIQYVAILNGESQDVEAIKHYYVAALKMAGLSLHMNDKIKQNLQRGYSL